MTIKTLNADIPEELEETLEDIVCEACDGLEPEEICEYRRWGDDCGIKGKMVQRIHEAYWRYQMKELKGVS